MVYAVMYGETHCGEPRSSRGACLKRKRYQKWYRFFCFDGIPKGSIVAVSTIGVKRHEETLQIWKSGMDAMIERINPSVILVYGGELEYDYSQGIDVRYYENLVMKELRENTKRNKAL